MTRGKQYRDDKFIEKLSRQLEEIRIKKKLTHEKVAEKTQLDTRQIGRILRGESNYSISQFAEICRGLDVHPVEVLREIGFSFKSNNPTT